MALADSASKTADSPSTAEEPTRTEGAITRTLLRWPFRAVQVMSGPFGEANLLLPGRLDPFSREVEQPWFRKNVREDDDGSKREFKPSEQIRLLRTSLAPRVDVPPDKARWKWHVTAGGSFRQGNVATTNVRSNFSAERRSNKAVLMNRLDVVYNRDGDAKSNRKASGEVLIDRNLRGRWVVFARETAEFDEARLIDLRSVTSTGIGFKFIDELNVRLIARTGPTVS